MVWHVPVEGKKHRRRALDQKLAGAHDKRGVCVTDASGELPERTRVTSMRVRPEQNLQREEIVRRRTYRLRAASLESQTFLALPIIGQTQRNRENNKSMCFSRSILNDPWMANHIARGFQ